MPKKAAPSVTRACLRRGVGFREVPQGYSGLQTDSILQYKHVCIYIYISISTSISISLPLSLDRLLLKEGVRWFGFSGFRGWGTRVGVGSSGLAGYEVLVALYV